MPATGQSDRPRSTVLWDIVDEDERNERAAKAAESVSDAETRYSCALVATALLLLGAIISIAAFALLRSLPALGLAGLLVLGAVVVWRMLVRG